MCILQNEKNLQPGQQLLTLKLEADIFLYGLLMQSGDKAECLRLTQIPDFQNLSRIMPKKKAKIILKRSLLWKMSYLLLEGVLDLVFMRNVTHHLPNRVDYFRKLRDMLKPKGRIAIIEYRNGGGFSFHRMFRYFVPKEVIVAEIHKAGYQLKEEFDFLPEQSFAIFSM